jgi:quercetin dioxygenase-like cupin family protein
MTFTTLADQPTKELIPGFHGRFIHGEQMTVAYWEIEAGAILPEHAHHHEQIANLLQGEFELTVAGETRHLKPGSVAVIPSNVPHSGRALTKCRIMDIFCPARLEYS